MSANLIATAREQAGLSRAELARRAGTSRPTLSAYEHGRVSPNLQTLERILAATGNHLVTKPDVRWREVPTERGRVVAVPDALPELLPGDALRSLELPLHLSWSHGDRRVDLADRRQRARIYEVLLREGGSKDIAATVDGTLLVDLWNELVLPRQLRAAWQPLIDQVRPCRG